VVDTVPSFFSSRRNWDSPNPSPAGECAPSPYTVVYNVHIYTEQGRSCRNSMYRPLGRQSTRLFSSHRNWDSPNPSPAGEYAFPPTPPVLRGGHTRWPERGWERGHESPLVCIDLFRQNSVFTSLHLKSPAHVVPPPVNITGGRASVLLVLLVTGGRWRGEGGGATTDPPPPPAVLP
jgi:hypothetical protein